LADLSAREREVLHLITLGASNHRIADDLGISENTAKFHVSNLLRKAGARNRAELAALAR
ncbi:helix-turn-helix transcriptional regulator, partial [Rathayibacter sp. ZW T2_19]